MAATKKPKTTPKAKSIDVTSPEPAQPDHTSRPIIVSNRPMIKDPMMTAAKPAPATPSTSPVLPTRVAKTIVPQSEASPAEDDSKSAEKPEETPSSDTAPEVEDRQVPQLVKAIQREKAEAEAAQAQEPDATDTDVPASPDAPVVPPATPDAPSEEPTDSADSETDETPPEATDLPVESEGPAPDTEEATDVSTPDTADATNQPTDKDGTTLDEAAKQVTDGQKETQAQEHIQQLIDQKTYYLPIKVAKKRHTFLVLLLLIGIAAAAYFYVTMM